MSGLPACAQRRLALVNDLLDISALENNELRLDRGPVNMRALVSEALLAVQVRACIHSGPVFARVWAALLLLLLS